jgi:hypothetical protein
MTITLPRSVLLGLALAALSMMGIVPAAGAATVRPAADPHAAAPTPSPVLHGQACPNVMVIAARGTNEAPINWQDLSAYTTSQNYYGAGAEIYSLYQSLESGSADTFSLDPVVYPVTLPSGTSLPGLVGSTVQYLGDARIGAEGIALDIQNTDAECGHTVHYILAGYSLGAWAVHDALHELSPAQLGEISGVALFGDPLFVPFLPTVRDWEPPSCWTRSTSASPLPSRQAQGRGVSLAIRSARRSAIRTLLLSSPHACWTRKLTAHRCRARTSTIPVPRPPRRPRSWNHSCR